MINYFLCFPVSYYRSRYGLKMFTKAKYSRLCHTVSVTFLHAFKDRLVTITYDDFVLIKNHLLSIFKVIIVEKT